MKILAYIYFGFMFTFIGYLAWLYWKVSLVTDSLFYLGLAFTLLSSILWFKARRKKAVATIP